MNAIAVFFVGLCWTHSPRRLLILCLSAIYFLKAKSHRHARHDKTVLSVSRPQRRCELGSRQLKTVADRKFEL